MRNQYLLVHILTVRSFGFFKHPGPEAVSSALVQGRLESIMSETRATWYYLALPGKIIYIRDKNGIKNKNTPDECQFIFSRKYNLKIANLSLTCFKYLVLIVWTLRHFEIILVCKLHCEKFSPLF